LQVRALPGARCKTNSDSSLVVIFLAKITRFSPGR
jgi:hypothetical protein